VDAHWFEGKYAVETKSTETIRELGERFMNGSGGFSQFQTASKPVRSHSFSRCESPCSFTFT
jgi:hypothetical protein